MRYKVFIAFALFLTILFSVEAYGIRNDVPTYKYFLQFMCQVHEVPYGVAYAVAMVESEFEMRVSSMNSNGSYDIGIFQLNSNYVDWFVDSFWYEGEDFDAYKPENNIEMGVIYLRHLYDRTNDWEKAIRVYHLGMTGYNTYPEASDYYYNKVERAFLR